MGAIRCSAGLLGAVDMLAARSLDRAPVQNGLPVSRYGDLMRSAVLLLCLAVAGCASTGSDDALNAASPTAAAAPAGAAEPPAPAAVPSRPARASAAEESAAPPTTPAQRLTQVRVDCWMRVEKDRSAARNIDRRIALVDKCVADKTKAAR